MTKLPDFGNISRFPRPSFQSPISRNLLARCPLGLPYLLLWLTVAAFLTFPSVYASAPGEQTFAGRWRDKAHGGVNVLYCYLRLNGIPCNYSNLVKQADLETQPQSALTLARLAARSGQPLRTVSLTFDQLAG